MNIVLDFYNQLVHIVQHGGRYLGHTRCGVYYTAYRTHDANPYRARVVEAPATCLVCVGPTDPEDS